MTRRARGGKRPASSKKATDSATKQDSRAVIRNGRESTNCSHELMLTSVRAPLTVQNDVTTITQNAPLLLLPTELSDEIWKHYYADGNVATVYYLTHKKTYSGRRALPEPKLVIKRPDRSLQLVCKKLNADTHKWCTAAAWGIEIALRKDDSLDLTPVFSHQRLAPNLQLITSLWMNVNYRTHIRSITDSGQADFDSQWHILASSLPNLKHLHVTFSANREVEWDRLGRDNNVRSHTEEHAQHMIALLKEFRKGDFDQDYYRHSEVRHIQINNLVLRLAEAGNSSCKVILKVRFRNRENTGLVKGWTCYRYGSTDEVEFKVTPDGFETINRWAQYFPNEPCAWPERDADESEVADVLAELNVDEAA